MSMQENDPNANHDAGEPFVERWSRLKRQARAPEARTDPAAAVAPVPAPDGAAASALATPPAVELPDLSQLDQDSDYSAFLTPGVDAALRKRALRQLFRSPKFNVFDGLDTYRDDFRNFAPLGDVVTADMRHHLERIAREAAKKAIEASEAGASPALASPDSTQGADSASEPPGPVTHPPDSSTDKDLDHRTD